MFVPSRRTLSLFLVGAVVAAGSAVADDWPQWQGPGRDAVSQEKGLLQSWPEGGPPLAWRVDGLGGGDGAPAVVDGRIFGMSARDGQEIVWALSEADGREIWVTPLGDAVEQRVPQSQEGPACTPTVDGDRLYVLGMGGRLACLSVEKGEVIWQRSLVEDFRRGRADRGAIVNPRWSTAAKSSAPPAARKPCGVAAETGVRLRRSPAPKIRPCSRANAGA